MPWSEEYESALKNAPEADTVLKTITGAPVKLDIILKEGHPPFIYGRAYVPELVGCAVGWYAQGADDWTSIGWKCVLMTKARHEVVKRFGLGESIFVQSLKVIRKSQSGKALLCEVHEWLEVSHEVVSDSGSEDVE